METQRNNLNTTSLLEDQGSLKNIPLITMVMGKTDFYFFQITQM